MSERPVWMETEWTQRDFETTGRWTSDAARLCASAPALVRALLAVEWTGDEGDWGPCCGLCGELKPGPPNGEQTWPTGLHLTTCDLDAALTAAGFTDQASRDEARRLMGEEKR